MENVSNISSEEELMQLRDEGKVNEAEYQDLLAAMRKTSPSGEEKLAPAIDKTKSKRKLGRIAFTLMLVGIILPALFFVLTQIMAHGIDANSQLSIGSWVVIGAAFEIAALVMGILAWPDILGKATVITIGVVAVLALLFTS